MNQHIQKQIEQHRKQSEDGTLPYVDYKTDKKNAHFIDKQKFYDWLKTSLESVWEEAEVNTITLLMDAIEETYGLELTSRIFRTLNEKVKEAKSLKQTT